MFAFVLTDKMRRFMLLECESENSSLFKLKKDRYIFWLKSQQIRYSYVTVTLGKAVV